jgi:hypothetical protein
LVKAALYHTRLGKSAKNPPRDASFANAKPRPAVKREAEQD